MKQLFVTFLLFLYFQCLTLMVCGQSGSPNEPISDLVQFCSKQKGFNLLGKFDVSWSNQGFTENEFRQIHDLGFNFVRLPLDYRTYTKTADWFQFTETELKKIDNAVQWGIKYDVHVCINLHRAPGFCVNSATLPTNQQLNLWTDLAAQDAFVKHWEVFANRYKDIAPDKLSFNLVNEPTNVTEDVYAGIMKRAIQKIHSFNQNRVVFVDGLNYGRNFVLQLKGYPNVAQAIHCYDPFTLTHYKASWVEGSDSWATPVWPMLPISNYLYGTWKSEFKSPLSFEGNFPMGTKIIVNVFQVSSESTLSISTEKKTIYSKKFICGPDTGADFSKIVKNQWGYQNISNKNFQVVTPELASRISFENTSGDWMILNSITLIYDGKEKIYYLTDNTWGKKQNSYKIDTERNIVNKDGSPLIQFSEYRNAFLTAQTNNIPVMVQEFGVHNQTPHKTTLAFLSDLTAFFRESKIGWALWNFNGSFGIINSDRKDCSYEPFEGLKLDRQMLTILKTTNTISAITPANAGDFKIFPSPAREVIYISAPMVYGIKNIKLFNLQGKLLKSTSVNITQNQPISLEISDLEKGVYIVNIYDTNFHSTNKLVVY